LGLGWGLVPQKTLGLGWGLGLVRQKPLG